ncbi:MAG: GNAT family N-acetyltransferase [Acidobacteriota bacterium]|nr:GNAT family N-acetyltransferase [Acidobacteriota bacterium]
MNIHNLERLFQPHRIALIGVTSNPKSVGGKILSNLIIGGFKGVVYPVNPAHEAVLGIQCRPSLADLPAIPDLGIVCAPAAEVPDIVRDCGRAGIGGLIIVSAGFRETGPEGAALEAAVRREAAAFEGLRILGPNCLGFISPGRQLNASFAAAMPKAGDVAFISQSGALCTAVLDWALQEKVGFSHFVSVGNAMDVGFAELIDYFGEDEGTRAILLYIESVSNARRFMTAARAFARTKPIIVYKAGRFPESAQAAASHTGALASEDAVYDEAFRRAGLVRVLDIGEIFDAAELLARRKVPRGDRLAIITNAGGPGVMATDALVAARGRLAVLADGTRAALDEALPPAWSHRNPVDILGDANSKRLVKAARIVLQDPNVDALLLIVTPQAMTNPTAMAKETAAAAAESAKPVLAAWMGGSSIAEGVGILNEAGIPTFETPEQAVRAFMTLVSYARNLESLYETPKDVPVDYPMDREALRAGFEPVFRASEGILSEADSKALLRACGIRVSLPIAAPTADEAVRAAEVTGYPVVLKIDSPDINHKTDVGGVALDLAGETEVRSAFARLLASAAAARPEARLGGVTVQPMIRYGDGLELILGAKKDAVFGTVLMAGLGGTAAELLGDRALGFPPLNERLARRMLESLKIWPLLSGYRGKPALAVEALVEVMIRLSYLAAEFPEIAELDINPLLVTPEGATALDARIVVDRAALGLGKANRASYPHLALRPYPQDAVRSTVLPDGSACLLRPIKPEDEPLWLELLGLCSKESIYMRFRGFPAWSSHDTAVRYCYLDYDREMAIVAEVEEGGRRRLLGIGRLIADPMRATAEYAVLVGDPWQDKGLGGVLTDYCLAIARDWGVRRITAVTTSNNPRMIAVFEKRGFRLQNDPEGSTVEAELDLD